MKLTHMFIGWNRKFLIVGRRNYELWVAQVKSAGPKFTNYYKVNFT